VTTENTTNHLEAVPNTKQNINLRFTTANEIKNITNSPKSSNICAFDSNSTQLLESCN
jgi:hypothetical protein